MKKHLIALISLFIITLASCAAHTPSGKALTETDWFIPDQTLTVWMLSDTHITDKAHIKPFENAIADINENVPDVDMAINAGDVVDSPKEKSYDLYINTRKKSYIKEWHEISGTHDDNMVERGKMFQSRLQPNPNYTVRKGNILFIFISNVYSNVYGKQADELFEWWKNLVIKNQDKIIVTITHKPLDGSGITFSGMKRKHLSDSKRFRDVLKEYKVDLWFSGHLHIPEEMFGTIVSKQNLNGTTFIEISSIKPDLMGMKEPESRVITFACGSDKVLVRSRNHTLRIFIPGTDEALTLSKPYKCDSPEVSETRPASDTHLALPRLLPDH
jgi:predicted phosphodiesterase